MDIYEKIKLDNDMPIRFKSFASIKDDLQFKEKHWHRSIEIIVVLKGELCIWVSGKNFLVNSGAIFIINSREEHFVYGDNNEDFNGYMFQIDYDFLVNCFKDIDSIYFEQIKKDEIKYKVLELIEKMKFYYEGDDEFKTLAIKGNLYILIRYLLSFQKRVRKDGKLILSDKNRDRILKITKYIDEHCSENLTIEMIAENFNLSYGHLVRFFKENLHMTVKEYITNIRMNRSKNQLINTDYPIVHIALENGFPNIQSFYKEFNKSYNITPAKFRKISQNNK